MGDIPEILAVIPARSGSKGLKNKNIRPLGGHPLIYWAIKHALSSTSISRTVFSSDSSKYCELAKNFGAEAPFIRPDYLANDRAIDLDVLLHAVEWLKLNEGYQPTHIIRLQPTNPTFTGRLIDNCVAKFLANPTLDSLRPITITPKHPYKMWIKSAHRESIIPFATSKNLALNEAHNQSRTELPPVYSQVGTCEVLKIETLIVKKSMAGERVGYLEIDNPLHTPNIDTLLDFLTAEQALKQLGLIE